MAAIKLPDPRTTVHFLFVLGFCFVLLFETRSSVTNIDLCFTMQLGMTRIPDSPASTLDYRSMPPDPGYSVLWINPGPCEYPDKGCINRA